MLKPRILILDTGISKSSKGFRKISKSYEASKKGDFLEITKSIAMDTEGHGTAVSHIIESVNSNIDIINFKMCNNDGIEECELIEILEYIYDNIDVDIINISAGVTYQYKHFELHRICRKLYKKGVLIVAAFDNDGAISSPAMFDEVVGVDVTQSYYDKNDIYWVKNSIVDILVPDTFYRTFYLDKKTIIKGSSFAAAKITGMLSLNQPNGNWNKEDVIGFISNKKLNCDISISPKPHSFQIKNAIIFPANKEAHALLRFQDLLNFNIVGVYDEKVSGKVGTKMFGHNIKSYDAIDWVDSFDTIILSCISELSKLTKRSYIDEIFEKSEKCSKNTYSFEDIVTPYHNVFHPKIESKMTPYYNRHKLHHITIPVVGVFGTSSKQGKFSLQLELIRRFRKKGYKTGHISTEPSGYLFEADFVFHCGYNASLDLEPWQCTALLNQMVWETQLRGKDILITGGQSGTIQYADTTVERFTSYQYAYMLGVQPDFCVLCVNPHDDIDYIKNTIGFINSSVRGNVQAIVIYPIQAMQSLSGISYKTVELTNLELKAVGRKYLELFNIPVYALSENIDIDTLIEAIVNYF